MERKHGFSLCRTAHGDDLIDASRGASEIFWPPL
jgi:hypothetical protein